MGGSGRGRGGGAPEVGAFGKVDFVPGTRDDVVEIGGD